MGPKKAEILNKEADIYSLYDLIQTFPYRYVDRSRFYKIAEIENERLNIPYEQRVVDRIRQVYSVDDELAILRQCDTKPDEFIVGLYFALLKCYLWQKRR